jgi:hypothetical protein
MFLMNWNPKMTINISYNKLNGNVVDNYTKTLKGFRNKYVTWDNMRKVVCDSSIQYSCYAWNNGVKKSKQFDNSKQDCIILDIDDGLSISDIQGMFSRYKYLLATTKSHQQEKKGITCDRFRLILPAINIPRDTNVYFRTLEVMFYFNDKQTLTKTGAFLGYDKAIYIYNDGDIIDLHKGSLIAEEQLKMERVEKKAKEIDSDLLDVRSGSSIQDIKKELNQEIVLDIVESLGYDVCFNKFKLREEERTHSAKVYQDGFIKDYGGDFVGDIFDLLHIYHGMNFRDSIQYIRRFM